MVGDRFLVDADLGFEDLRNRESGARRESAHGDPGTRSGVATFSPVVLALIEDFAVFFVG